MFRYVAQEKEADAVAYATAGQSVLAGNIITITTTGMGTTQTLGSRNA